MSYERTELLITLLHSPIWTDQAFSLVHCVMYRSRDKVHYCTFDVTIRYMGVEEMCGRIYGKKILQNFKPKKLTLRYVGPSWLLAGPAFLTHPLTFSKNSFKL